MARKKRTTRKSVAIALGIVSIAGLSMASAAQLTITSAEVSAGTQVVASCDTDGVSVAYTTSFNSTAGQYVVTGVSVSSIDTACNGKTLSATLLNGTGTVALFDGSDTVLGSGSATVTTGAASITGLTGVLARNVEGIAISIA